MKRQSTTRLATYLTAIAATALMGCQVPGAHAKPPAVVPPEKIDSVTVYPIWMGDRLYDNVGDALGLVLEKQGVPNVWPTDHEFTPALEVEWEQAAKAFGQKVRKDGIKSEHALLAAYVGSRAEGVKEIRIAVVDEKGQVVLRDVQTRDDPAFKRTRPGDPMACCFFVAERLKPYLDTSAHHGEQGRMMRVWAERSGLPAREERAAIEQREEKFEDNAPNCQVVIYPPRIGDEVDRQRAEHLVAEINKRGWFNAQIAKEAPVLKVAGNSNEQRVLWDLAKRFQDYVKEHPPAADYALYADYLMAGEKVGAVHFVICDRSGAWVVVDFQNSHHADFQAVKPQSRADCDELLLRMLKDCVQ